MHSYLITFTSLLLMLPHIAIAGTTFDVYGIPESIVQFQEQSTALIADEESLKKDETKLENKGESGKLKKENVQEPEITLKDKDTAPFTSSALAAELKQKNPSVPKVENIFKKEFYLDAKTFYKTSDETSSKNQENTPKNSLEQFQMQSHLTFENARAIALKANQLTEDQDKEFQALKKDLKERNSTSDLQKGIAILTYKSGAILNEIAILRNSYLEIEALNSLQGTEQAPSGGVGGSVSGMIKGAAGL